MVLALAPPLVLAAELELAVGALLGTGRVGGGVAGGDLGRDLVEADAAEPADGAGEVALDELGAEADGLEDLGAGVAGHRRHAHLRHHLEHALAARLDVVAHRLARVDGPEAVEVLGDQVLDRLEREVGVDRAGAVADQQRHVVHLAGVAALDDQPDHRALLGAHEVVVHGRGEQQRRDRRLDGVGVAVGQHDHPRPGLDRRRHLGADRGQRPLERQPTAGHPVQPLDDVRPQAREATVVVGVDDLRQLVVVDDRVRQGELAAALRAGREQVVLGADRRRHRRHDLLADGVEWRVGHLGEELGEVVEQQPRPVGQHGDRRVGAHRADRLDAVERHRGDDDLELLVGVAEQLLAAQHAVVAEHDVLARREIVELDQAVLQPLGVRMLGGEGGLDLLVVDDAPLGGVDEEHPPRLQPALGDHLRRVDVDDADLGRHHDDVVVGDPVAAGPQPVAVEHGADDGAVGERDAGRAVPRLHQRGVEPVERPLVGVHLAVVLPRRRDHHQHGVVDRAPGEVEQLEHLVEAGGVRRARSADRVRPIEVGQQRAGQHRLARPHPVLVALHRVDLAVVGDVAVRVGERPRRERVGREAAVDEQQRALEALVGEVGEERRQLRRGQHPLVDERARRTATRSTWRSSASSSCSMRLRTTYTRRSRSMPRARRDRRRRRCLNEASPPAPSPRGSPARPGRGARRRPRALPRRRSSRSPPRPSRRRRCRRAGTPGRRRRRPPAAARHRSTARRKRSGTWTRIPAPSPVSASAPVAPRWARLVRALEAGAHQLVAGHALDVGHERDAARVVFESRVVAGPTGPGECLHRPRSSTEVGAGLVDVRDDAGPNGRVSLR